VASLGRDIGIINEELLLKDLNFVASTAEGMERNVSRGVGGKDVSSDPCTHPKP
jgi:ribosome-binding ATPase YchF (GTP1/OBG family)